MTSFSINYPNYPAWLWVISTLLNKFNKIRPKLIFSLFTTSKNHHKNVSFQFSSEKYFWRENSNILKLLKQSKATLKKKWDFLSNFQAIMIYDSFKMHRRICKKSWRKIVGAWSKLIKILSHPWWHLINTMWSHRLHHWF